MCRLKAATHNTVAAQAPHAFQLHSKPAENSGDRALCVSQDCTPRVRLIEKIQ